MKNHPIVIVKQISSILLRKCVPKIIQGFKSFPSHTYQNKEIKKAILKEINNNFSKEQIKTKLPLKIFFLLLSISLITRIFLFNGNGFHFFPDESWYSTLRAGMHKSIENFNPLYYIQSVIPLFGRPGYGILYLPVLLIGELTDQQIVAPLIFNIIINIACIVLIYLIIKKIDSSFSAFIASIFIIFSMSSVSYIRHSLPYDSSLFILLIGIYIFFKNKSFFLLGLISGFSFLTYLGYYFYFLSFIIFLFVYPNIFRFYRNIYSVFKFITGFFSIIFFVELISRTGINVTERSYIETALHVSKIAVQGDWLPAIIFLKQYILAIDGNFGILMTITSILALFLSFRIKPVKIISSYLLSTYITLELMSFITHKTVLYGRTIRIFYIIIIILAGIGLSKLLKLVSIKLKIINIPKSASLSLAFLFIFIFIIINWIPRYIEFKNLVYPEDFIKNVNALNNENKNSQIEIIYPSQNKQIFTNVKKNNYYIVNAGVFYPYFGMTKINCDYKLLLEKPHAFSYKPYQLEGYTENMRKNMNRDIPKYQLIFCK